MRATTAPGKSRAHTRIICCKVQLQRPVGFLGDTHVVTVVHLHSHLARGAFGTKKLEAWWDFLRDHINQYGVKVLVGDFNMSVTRVIPALRSRGVVIDLASFYAWKDLDGNPMADSCGIFMVNCPGHHAPFPSREKLNDAAPDGWFTPAPPTDAGPAEEQEDGLYD